MPSPPSSVLLSTCVAGALMVAACGGGLFGKVYEYEEQLQLGVDGSAEVTLSASIPALVALRGMDLDPSADVDRDALRAMFEGPGVEVRSVRESRRSGRRFVHVRLTVEDVRQLSRVGPFSWSTYQFGRRGEMLEFKQVVGAAADKSVGHVGWSGRELVAFRMHIPSVISYHNAPSKEVQRGNILEWEQALTERLRSAPVELEVTMQPDSILYSTLLLFGTTIVLAAVVFAIVIWRVAKRGRDEEPEVPLNRSRV